jgi:hypothetical protein
MIASYSKIDEVFSLADFDLYRTLRPLSLTQNSLRGYVLGNDVDLATHPLSRKPATPRIFSRNIRRIPDGMSVAPIPIAVNCPRRLKR